MSSVFYGVIEVPNIYCNENHGKTILKDISARLQEVAAAPGHNGSPLAIEAVDHDHQVHVGVLLLDAAVAPGALHLVVCVLSGGNQGEALKGSLIKTRTAKTRMLMD